MRRLLIMTLVALLSTDGARAEAVPAAPECLDLEAVFSDLQSMDGNKRKNAVEAILLEKRRVMFGLSQIVSRGAAGDLPEKTTQQAILLMGQIRDEKAVPVLLENLKFTAKSSSGFGVIFYETTPAVRALIDIGLPSLDPLLKNAAITDDEVIRERAAIVIDQVLGTDMAVLFVQDRRDREKNDLKRQRLTRLIEQIDKCERNRKHKIYIGPLNPPPVVSERKRG